VQATPKNLPVPGSINAGADPACWVDRLPKFENSKMVWNYCELITCMYRIDVWASHYKINLSLLINVSGYKY